MPRQLRVFLCHASQDKPAVWKLHRYLKQHGISPWLDQADLIPGQNWEVEIPKALFNSDVILVCLSKNSVNKEGYVQKEIVFALDKAMEKPEGTIFIIPVKLEECEVPKRLSPYQWVDYFRLDGRKRLLLGLNVRASDLGEDVSPVILEDARKAKPITKPVDVEKQETEELIAREELERAGREAIEKATIEKEEHEKVERETSARLAREKEERAAAEKIALEKSEREKVERETAERIVRERTAREEIERAQAKQGVDLVSNSTIKTNEKPSRVVSLTSKDDGAPILEKKRGRGLPKMNILNLGIGGIIFACLLFAALGGNYLYQQMDFPVTTTTTPVPALAAEFIATASIIPNLGIGSTKYGEDGMTLIYVPEGEFTMGSDTGESDSQPVHTVNLDAFWVDQTEVTNAMYAKCVADGGCTPPYSSSSNTHESYYGNSQYDDYPVIYVDWNQANEYCLWAGRRLPTEAEWEKSARGTDGRTYPWGENISCDFANYYDGNRYCIGDTSKVGSYPDGISIYGAFDMAGNVWEWVSSVYQDYPYSATDGREDLDSFDSRVLRGGSWGAPWNGVYTLGDVRSTFRSRYDFSYTAPENGFRCSLSHQ